MFPDLFCCWKVEENTENYKINERCSRFLPAYGFSVGLSTKNYVFQFISALNTTTQTKMHTSIMQSDYKNSFLAYMLLKWFEQYTKFISS